MEQVQNLPESITTIDPEKLDVLKSGGDDIQFLSARVPSLLIESSFGRTFPRFYIRGLGNTDFDLNASQPVSLVYDDIVLENPILKGFPIFDIDQVEVLRGPQGTLFGRNTPAGVVKLDSKKPTQDTEGYVDVSYGNLGNANLEGAIGGAPEPGLVGAPVDSRSAPRQLGRQHRTGAQRQLRRLQRARRAPAIRIPPVGGLQCAVQPACAESRWLGDPVPRQYHRAWHGRSRAEVSARPDLD